MCTCIYILMYNDMYNTLTLMDIKLYMYIYTLVTKHLNILDINSSASKFQSILHTIH